MRKVEMYLDDVKLKRNSIGGVDKIINTMKDLCVMPNMSVEQSFTTRRGELKIIVKRGA